MIPSPVMASSLNEHIKSKTTHSIYPSLLATIPSLVFIASMLVYKLNGHVSQLYLTSWLGVFLVMTACQAALAIWYNKTKYHARFERLYSKLLIADVTMLGLLWGAAGVMFMPPDTLGQSYLILIATFVAGGGLLYLSRSYLAGVMYTAGILMPLVASLVLSFFSTEHHEIYFNITVGLGCYWLLLMAVSHRSSQLHAENQRHEVTNQALLEELAHANSELEAYMCAAKRDEEHLFSEPVHTDAHQTQVTEAVAYTDAVTGLDSPAMQTIRFIQARAYARRHHQSIAVFRININNYSAVQNQYGEEAANLLLKTAGVRLQYCKRETDIACRLQANQMTLIITEVRLGHEISTVANRVVKMFAEKTVIEQGKVGIDASIGISLFSRDGEELPDLIRVAETALAAMDQDRGAHAAGYRIHSQDEIAVTPATKTDA